VHALRYGRSQTVREHNDRITGAAHPFPRRRPSVTDEMRGDQMTDGIDRRSVATRHQIIGSAAKHFADKPYSLVSLDEILTDAAVTKGAMYFHFRSKHALGTAIIERWVEMSLGAVADVVARQHSAVETLVDVTFLIALDDIGEPLARAGFNLLESIGRGEEIQRRVIDTWVSAFRVIVERAQAEGDIATGHAPEQVAKLLVAFYLGVRRVTDLGDRSRYLTDLEQAWALVLPGVVKPERVGYLTTFIRRRTALAVNRATP